MSQLVDLDDLITSAEAAALLLIKNTTLEIWRIKGKGPAYIKLGDSPKAAVRYRRSVVLAWRERHVFRSTSAHTAAVKQNIRTPSPAEA